MRGFGFAPGMGRPFGMLPHVAGGFFTLLLVVAVVVLVIALLRQRGLLAGGGYGVASGRTPDAGAREALAIAQRRLASGEIGREQYEEIRDALLTEAAAHSPSPPPAG